MSQLDVALILTVEMIRKSGVREWDDSDVRNKITIAALEMANAITEQEGDTIPSNVYKIDETTIVFGSEVGDDVAWSTENISSAAGRQSAFHDQGAGSTARALTWMYRFYTQAQATPTLGNACELYLKTSDGTHPDNDDGTGDAALSSSNKLKNLTLLGLALCDEAAANIEYVCRGQIEIPERYFGCVLYNSFGSAITNDAAETKAEFTPVVTQIQ